ncbi:MAG: hypothetical protein LC769_10585, partial [Chloroflexi bacterium]|nr:hypothetical protein [Chloroflexota bacterium]
EEFEEFDTVGGLVFHHVGHVPLVGDEIRVDGILFTIERMEGTRIAKVRAVLAGPAEDAVEGEDHPRPTSTGVSTPMP